MLTRVVTRPSFGLTGGWGSPKLDLAGCVLYAPLWRPDQAGSPFTSKPPIPHLATVTGALWTPQGRTFDGTDDFISAGNAAPLDTLAGAFSLEVWFKPTSLGGNSKGIITKGDLVNTQTPASFSLTQGQIVAGDAKGLNVFVMDDTNDARIGYGADNVFTAGYWYHLVSTYSGGTTTSSTKLYANGVLLPVDTDNAGGVFVSMTSSTHNLNLGRALVNAAYVYNACTIGEVRVYTRALTILEIQRNYLATKWRYQ